MSITSRLTGSYATLTASAVQVEPHVSTAVVSKALARSAGGEGCHQQATVEGLKAATIDSQFRLRDHPGMTASKPRGEEPSQDDTALLIAALNHAWTMYDTRVNPMYQLVNYYVVASAIVASAYASAINGKHYGLAAIFSVAGIGLSAIAFAFGLDQKRTADKAEPALITLEDQIASKLAIDSLRVVKAGYERRIMTIALPVAGLLALLGIGTLLYALIH